MTITAAKVCYQNDKGPSSEVIVDVEQDGSCFYHAVSLILTGTDINHQVFRQLEQKYDNCF